MTATTYYLDEDCNAATAVAVREAATRCVRCHKKIKGRGIAVTVVMVNDAPHVKAGGAELIGPDCWKKITA